MPNFRNTLLAGSALAFIATTAHAGSFDIAGGDLKSALGAYAAQTGVPLMVSDEAIRGVRSHGVKGDLSDEVALTRILSGTGFIAERHSGGTIAVVRSRTQSSDAYDIRLEPMQLAQAAPQRAAVETVTVTSSKLGGADVQSIPIAITALSQEQLTATQTAGGPDLVKQVPNLTFTKTNFSGYSIQIRGIGTQAISVTTDPAVAVAMNDIPFIRNHFFEQEFFDVGQLEVLRGPQGTLYGRNATAGVVNITTAKPTDQFEAMASGELGNYHQRRFEGMINLPIVDDRLDLRLAGEWTKRQGYSFNSITDNRIDGRDLWSGRATLGLKPADNVQMYLVWEHFSEDDDRLRSSKQLCNRAPDVEEVNGVPVKHDTGSILGAIRPFLNQGCQAASLYSPDSFQVVNGRSLSYYGATGTIGGPVYPTFDPYANAVNSPNLRVIESILEPTYKAKNDVVELNTDYNITPTLTFTSQTGFSHDFLWGSQDYNRYNSQPGAFNPNGVSGTLVVSPDGVFCDPQLGCSNRLVAQDLVREYAWQLSQEFRVASHLSGPFNFSVCGNYMHYETHENYYVFINSLSALAAVQDVTPGSGGLAQYIPGVTDGLSCLPDGPVPGNPKQGGQVFACIYMDPNPITKLNDQGHNYFLSQNPYNLNSYATFGEAYYNITPDLKLIGGVRWTRDEKHFPLMPSWLLSGNSYGYPVTGIVDQQWSEVTGRFAANWTPKLSFTDQTLIYASYARGYKAGGANPPPATPVGGNAVGSYVSAVHPLTFDPEFINAFELGTKNTLLDGSLTLNGSLFQYLYKGYQISQIVDRTSVNLNFDAHINGAELEATWEPLPGLRFNFGGGYENARFDKGSKAIDLIDRTAGNDDWMVIKPYPTAPSNCIYPKYVMAAIVANSGGLSLCNAYTFMPGIDPITNLPYTPNPSITTSLPIPAGYPGYLPSSAPNNGEGFFKDISNDMMPNAPPFTASLGAQYTMPVTSDWAATLRADGYWQDNSWWRVFNDTAYDKLHGYASMNLTLILTSQAGWQVMLYDKNVFNTTAITGAFLNSDDSGLTTNVFLTDPKLIGVRVTKNW